MFPIGAVNGVNTLVRNFTTLSWKAPFSLELTTVEPDIVYCVDVYNITCGGRELLISDCYVTETSYTSDVIAPDGYIYEYIVTPRSNVEGAVNGTPSQSVRGKIILILNSIMLRFPALCLSPPSADKTDVQLCCSIRFMTFNL